jgi:site-specific recombinase XerD
MNLHEYAEKFYTSKLSAGRSAWTLRSYHFHIDTFLVWCDAQGYSDGDLWGVTGAEVLEEYQATKQKEGWKLHSINGTFRSLRALYNWSAKRFSEAQGNPFAYLTMPKTPDLLPKAISYNQYTVLLHNIGNGLTHWVPMRDRLLIRMLFECGPRASELLSMKVGDIDLDQRRLRLMRWKIHKEDFIPCSRSLRDELAIWLEQRPKCGHDGLWPSYVATSKCAGVPLPYDGLKKILRRRCKAAKLPIFRPHAFRHGCGVHIVMRGGDISLV